MIMRRSFLLILGVIVASAAAYYCVCGYWSGCDQGDTVKGSVQAANPHAGHSILRRFALPVIG